MLKVAILSRESAIKGDFYMGNQTETFKEILERDGTLVYKTKGISMLPMLRTNKDVIIIRAKKPGEIFKKYDVDPKDLQNIVPNLTYDNAIKYINQARKIMEEKNYLIPTTRPKVALAKIVNEMLGI